MCSHCGEVKTKLALRDREYECEACGMVMDRDRTQRSIDWPPGVSRRPKTDVERM